MIYFSPDLLYSCEIALIVLSSGLAFSSILEMDHLVALLDLNLLFLSEMAA